MTPKTSKTLTSPEAHAEKKKKQSSEIWTTPQQGGISFLESSGHCFSKLLALCEIFESLATKRFIYTILNKKGVLTLKPQLQIPPMRPILIRPYISSMSASQNDFGLRMPSAHFMPAPAPKLEKLLVYHKHLVDEKGFLSERCDNSCKLLHGLNNLKIHKRKDNEIIF